MYNTLTIMFIDNDQKTNLVVVHYLQCTTNRKEEKKPTPYSAQASFWYRQRFVTELWQNSIVHTIYVYVRTSTFILFVL